MGERMTAIAKEWRELPPDRRTHYEGLACVDKARFETESAARDAAALSTQRARDAAVCLVFVQWSEPRYAFVRV